MPAYNIGMNRSIPDPGLEAASPSLVQRASSSILELIKAEGLRVGDPLPSESALGLRLGVSRVVVREANRALAALGVIEISNGRTARVGAPSPEVLTVLVGHAVQTQHASVQQVLDVRRTLEARTVVLAALRRTPAQAATIVSIAEAMRDAYHDPKALMEQDIAFHSAIAEAAQNPLLTLFMGAFESVTEMTWPVTWRSRATEAARQEVLDFHSDIASAIHDQDCSRAEQAMARHFNDTVLALAAAGIA